MSSVKTQFKKGMTPWNKGQGMFVNCGLCEKPVWVQNHKLKISGNFFCSKTCGYKGRTLKGHYQKGHSKSFLGIRVHTEETKKKISMSNKGKHSGRLNSRWIADRSKLVRRQERNDTAYKEWRQQVWLRDNFKCKIANPDCCGRIEAHHILGWSQYPELRYQINNGITLCHAHHPRKRAEEKRLTPYFQELVSVSKVNFV